jgi:probable HAF family extracellular repeat protein
MNRLGRLQLPRLAAFGLCVLCAVQALRAAEQARASEPHRAHRHFDIVDLGPFTAREIDERPSLSGTGHVASWQIVGQTYATAVLSTAQGSQVLLGTPEQSNSFAFGINDANELVGILEARSDLRDTRAFFYRSAQLQVLPTLGGAHSAARSINAQGLIVGNAQTPELQVHAVSWLNGIAHDLGSLPGGDFSRAFEVNNSGDIAGEANKSHNGKVRAVLWSHGHIRELGLLPGGSFSSAQAVNGKHVAVGFADDADGGAKAVRFSNGRVTDLGSLGDEPSAALSINDNDQIVGNSPIAEGKMRAFLWEKGVMYDLNKLIAPQAGWALLTAYHINASAQILAYGFHAGRTEACLLTPINSP